MSLRFTRLSPALGAIVEGFDLSRPLNDSLRDTVSEALSSAILPPGLATCTSTRCTRRSTTHRRSWCWIRRRTTCATTPSGTPT